MTNSKTSPPVQVYSDSSCHMACPSVKAMHDALMIINEKLEDQKALEMAGELRMAAYRLNRIMEEMAPYVARYTRLCQTF